MAWEKAYEELEARRAAARDMGGTQRVARQHELNKLTVRERIDRLADAGTLREFGQLTGKGKYDEHGNLL